MINVEGIKNVTFRKSGFGGYKPFDVDSFVDEVQMSYEELMSENERLKEEINTLNIKIKKYQDEEGSIRNAILGAQKLADASLLDAENKSKQILLDAKIEADKILNDAKKEVDEQRKKLLSVYMDSEKFRHKLIKEYENQIDHLREFAVECKDNCFNLERKTVSADESLNIEDKDSDVCDIDDTKNIQNDLKSPNNIPLTVKFEKKENSNIKRLNKNNKYNSDSVKSKLVSEMEDIDSGLDDNKDKLKNLKFGSKYRSNQNKFGNGLYAGLFRRKK